MAPARIVRDRMTIALYIAMGLQNLLLSGWGAVLEPLREQLGVSRDQVAFYPSLFAAALIAVGLLGPRFIRRVGDTNGLVTALTVLSGGALLLGAPSRPLSIAGAALMGMAAALLIQMVPAELSRRHPAATVAVLGECNAVSSVTALIAPIAVAAAIAVGLGWRAGYVLPVLPVAALLIAIVRREGRKPEPEGGIDVVTSHEPAPGLEPGRLFPRWVAVVLVVSIEFCLIFWAAAAFIDWHGASDAIAPACAAAIILGMGVVRAFATPLTNGRNPLAVLIVVCVVAAVGFIGFWSSPTLAGSVIGLFVTGLGVGLMYPAAIARLVSAWPNDRDRAAGWGALASGTAIGVAPWVLARVSESTGLRAAYLVVPMLIVALGVLAAVAWVLSRRSRESVR